MNNLGGGGYPHIFYFSIYKKMSSATVTIGTVMGIILTLYIAMIVISGVEDSVATLTDVTVSNGTDITGVDTVTLNYSVSNSAAGRSGSLVVTYDNSTAISTIAIGSTSIGTLDGVSPQTFTVPSSAISNGVLGITYTVAGGENVTDTDFTYPQTDLSESMNTAYGNVQNNTGTTLTLASVYPIVIIAVVMIAAFAGFAYIRRE